MIKQTYHKRAMIKKSSIWACLAILLFSLPVSAQTSDITLTLPRIAVSNIGFTLTIQAPGQAATSIKPFTLRLFDQDDQLIVESTRSGALLGDRGVSLEGLTLPSSGVYRIQLTTKDDPETVKSLRVIPGWMTLLPPLFAIVIAILFRQVLLALAAGGIIGAFFLTGFDPFMAILRWGDHLILDSLSSPWNGSVVLVILILGGMIGIITRNGSIYGVVDSFTGWARSPRSGQLATWLFGLVIFFEGFVNTLVVGNTMRPVTDKLKISREKLSFIVDSTAAPVASIALISGWIGFEVGLIGDALASVDLDYNPYQTFVETIPYRFYPILMLFFVALIAFMDRDFGPMLDAERRCRTTSKVLSDHAKPLSGDEDQALQPPDGQSRHWIYAFIPLLIVIAITFWGMWATGYQAILIEGGDPDSATLWTIFGKGNASQALLWGSIVGTLSSLVLTIGFKLLTLSDCLDAWVIGAKSVFLAVIILITAWALVAACRELQTADFMVSITTGLLSPYLVPALTFIISALVSFSTGTSWGTMALIMPLVVPLTVGLSQDAGIADDSAYVLLLATISGVLSGAVWGDHCSPISDTTIMSSMATGADHIDHVRTQAPYALLVGFVGIVVGDLPVAFGMSPWFSLGIGAITLLAVLFIFGKSAEEAVT